MGVGQQHDLVRRGLGGARGRLLEPGAAIQDQHADHRLQPRDHAAVGLLVELRHARRVGRRGQHHQALERAPQMPVERGDREVGLLEDVAEVVDEDLVVGRQRRPSDPKSGLVSTATMRSRRTRASSEPSSTVVVVFPTPPFGETTAIVAQRVSRGDAIARSSRPT